MRQSGDTNTANPARYTTLVGNVDSALASSAKKVTATYKFAYNGHMSIGPTCALADYKPTGMTVWCNSQQISTVPTTLAGFQLNGTPYFGLPAQDIRCFFYEGSSSYGSLLSTGPATDVYIAAAVISKNVGAPVRLQWMRWDEHGWDAYGPGLMFDVTAGVDAIRQHHGARLDDLRAGRHDADADVRAGRLRHLAGHAAERRPGHGRHALHGRRRRPSGCLRRPSRSTRAALKSAALRAPNAPQQTFAAEQLIDELAVAANMDSVRVPQAERRPEPDRRCRPGRPALARRADRGGGDVELAAEGGRLDRCVAEGRGPQGPRRQLRHVRQHAGRERGRHPGERQDGQGPGDARLRRARQRRSAPART